MSRINKYDTSTATLTPVPNPDGTVDLKQGQAYTIDSGVTIVWSGNAILVSEPGLLPINNSVQHIDNAIKKAQDAQSSLHQKKFDEAEEEIVDAAQLITEALHLINELQHPSSNNWSVSGAPLVLTDGTGTSQNFTMENGYLFFNNGAGEILMVSDGRGPVSFIRVFPQGVTPDPNLNLKGFNLKQTTVYVNAGLSKVPLGTLADIYE